MLNCVMLGWTVTRYKFMFDTNPLFHPLSDILLHPLYIILIFSHQNYL